MAKVFLLVAVIYFSHSIFAEDKKPLAAPAMKACVEGGGTCLKQLEDLHADKAQCPSKLPSPPKAMEQCFETIKKPQDVCNKAQQLAADVQAQKYFLAGFLPTDALASAQIGKSSAQEVARAYDLAKKVCDRCQSPTCGESCKKEDVCSTLPEKDKVACGVFAADQVKECTGKIKPYSDQLAEAKASADTAVAGYGDAEGDLADKGKPAEPGAEPVDDGGGQQQQPQQQQQQPQQSSQDTAADDTEEETKKDDKVGAGGGGMADMMSGLSEMMNQEKEKEADLPCSQRTDAYAVAKCQEEMDFVSTCSQAKNANAEMCVSFKAHYCKAGSGAKVGTGYSTPGSGASTEYCQNLAMDDFCADPVRGNTCAGCLKRSSQKSCAATGGSVGCIADASCAMAQANPAVCAGDPYLRSSSYVATCVSAGLATGTAGASAQSVGGVGGGGGGGMSSLGVASAGGSAAVVEDYEGSREGLNMGVDSAGGYSQSVGGDDGGGESTVMVNGKRVAKSVAGSRGLATASAMPADVAGAAGPNLSNIVSEVIKIRCTQFKHLHCEPR